MTSARILRLPLLLLLAAAVPAGAQTRPAPPPAERPATPNVEPVPPAATEDSPGRNRRREVVRVGQDFVLRAGDEIGQAVLIAGTARIEGHVSGDVVIVLGKVQVAGTAVIDGSLIVIGGGSSTIAPGARLDHDLVVIGGGIDAPPEFMPGGEHVVIGPVGLGGVSDGLLAWVTRGLFLGRPFVPSLPWVWGFAGITFLVYLALTLIFPRPVRLSAETLARRPLSAFVVGLLVLLLAGPVCLLLTVSIIGVLVVPFLLGALLVAWFVGRVSAAHWIGMSLVRQEDAEDRLQSVRSFAIGFVVICLAYMVPVLGFITFTTVGVFGLGAAALAFSSAYRRENPRPEPRVRAAAAAPAPAPEPVYFAPPPNPEAAAVGYSAAAPSAEPPAVPHLLAFPHAAFRDRLAAFVLDVILVALVQQILDLTRRDSAIFLLLLAYHVGFWTWKNTTVGGIICQLRLVRVDGTRLGFGDALVRGLASIFSLVVVGMGALWILKDPERQSWHDKIAGTFVVKVPRNWPL